MSQEAEKLAAELKAAGNKVAVMAAGLGPVLKLVLQWVQSVERRLEYQENKNDGNT